MLPVNECPWPFTHRTESGQLVTKAPMAVFTEATAGALVGPWATPGLSISEVLVRLELWSAQCWIIAGMGPTHRLWYELYLLASGAAWTLQLQNIVAVTAQAGQPGASEVTAHKTPSPLGWVAAITLDGQEAR